jgi:long-subunit acyl-CoA synthetase (AMP-forming)
MNYDAAKDEEPAGEVLLRGPQLFSGYYKAPEKTAEVRAGRDSKYGGTF